MYSIESACSSSKSALPCCSNLDWRSDCGARDAKSQFLFFPSLPTLLIANNWGGRSEDETLLICIPAKAYWASLLERLLSHHLETHEEKMKRLRRLEDYDHIVADGATVKEATASALAVLRDAKVRYSADMLQLLVGRQHSKIKLWGASIEPEASGVFGALHQRMRSRMAAWLRMFDQLHHAALPAVLSTVCSIVANGVGLAVSNLITSRAEGLVAVVHMAAGGSLLGSLLQHGITSTVLYSAQWRQLKEALSLFIVPYLLALLCQLFPSAERLKTSGEIQLILASAVRALASLAKEYDRAEGKSMQDVVAVFMEYTGYLKLPPVQERHAQQVLSTATSTHDAISQLLRAASATEVMRALFGVAQVVLFSSSDLSVITFARSASVVVGGMVQRGLAVWTEADFLARHSKALQTAGRLRNPLAVWAAVSSSTAKAVGSGQHPTSSNAAVAEVVEALDGAYRVRIAEDLRMASCQSASQVVQDATRRWLQATDRLLCPQGDVSAKPEVLSSDQAAAAATTAFSRKDFRQQIASALVSSQSIDHNDTKWPDLETMDEHLASRVYAWERRWAVSSNRPATANSHRRRRRRTKSRETATVATARQRGQERVLVTSTSR